MGTARNRPPAPDHAAPAPSRTGLARVPFFRDADPAALTDAAPFARWLDIGSGELLLDFGEVTADVFIVVEGAVRVIVRTPLGQEVILGDLTTGDVFGEMAAIDGAPRSASVAALHPTRLCRLPAPTFMNLVLRSPEVAHRLLRTLTARLRMQDERMTELAVLPARHRLAAELLRLSRPREPGPARIISPPLQHHVLAARIGARRETVSLAFSELAREKLVEVSARAIVLPRPDKLRATIETQLRPGALGAQRPRGNAR